MTPQRQRLVLAGLIVIFLWVVWRQAGPSLGRSRGGRSGSPLAGAVNGPGPGEERGALEVAHLRLADLEAKPASYRPGRDPFRFAPERKAPRPRRKRPARQAVEAAPPPPPAPAPATAQPPPRRPPPVNLDYLGSFGPEARRIAVFSDGNDIFNAMIGDVLQEKFIVDGIGYESVDIRFVGFPEEPAKRLPAGG